MDELRPQAVAARVVAWHNRHPLARRIGLAQVGSIGYVALSLGDEPEGGLPPTAEMAAPPLPHADAPEPWPQAQEDFTQALEALVDAPAAPPESVEEVIEVVFPETLAVATEPAATDAPVTEADVEPASPRPAPLPADHPLPPPEIAAPDGPTQTWPPETEAPALPVASVPPPATQPERPAARTLRERALSSHQLPSASAPAITGPQAAMPSSPGIVPAALDSHFMAPLSPGRLLRWLLRHGRTSPVVPADAPVRRLAVASSPPGHAAGTLYVLTAAIDGGALRSRVLLGPGLKGEVLGTRLWSPVRLAVVAGSTLLLTAAGAFVIAAAGSTREPIASPHQAAAMPSAAPPAAAPVPMASSAPVAAPAAPPATAAADAERAAAGPSPEAIAGAGAPTAPPPLPERPGSEAAPKPPLVERITLGLHLSEEEKAAARQARAQALQQRGPPPEPPPMAGAPAAAAPPPTGASAPPAAAQTAYAVSTRRLRTRAEAEQFQVAMGALLQAKGAAAISLELLPQDDDWRVVAWPFAGRGEAEKARALLAGRGMRVEILSF